MKLMEIMRKGSDVVTCSSSDFVTDAARKMKEHNVGCILITEQGNLKGILTDRDITLTVVAEGKPAGDIRLQDIMRTNVVTGKPDWDIFEATRIMSEKRVRRLPIASNGKLEGYVSLSDIAPAIQKEVDSFLELERPPLAL